MKQWWFIILLIISFPLKADNIFVEAESFDCRGGWVLDNQSMGQMGSPYLSVSYTHLTLPTTPYV